MPEPAPGSSRLWGGLLGPRIVESIGVFSQRRVGAGSVLGPRGRRRGCLPLGSCAVAMALGAGAGHVVGAQAPLSEEKVVGCR